MRSFDVLPGGPFVLDGLDPLAEEAGEEGISNVRTLIDRWTDGAERFALAGELFLVAVSDGSVIGVGGRTWCPDVAGALRMRRFYVSPGWRRDGVGSALATELIDSAWAHTSVLSCNAQASPAAPRFWERMGFVPSAETGITHVRRAPG